MSDPIEAERLVRERGQAVALELFADSPYVRIFLFGSRASGRSIDRSDFDVGIDVGRPVPAAIMERVRDAFDQLPILQKVDVVDFSVADPEFARIAQRQVAILYERHPG